MHSTIAAFSTNVPTIPFSYSKKFEGLYNSLNYSYIVDGKTLETVESVDRTLQLIENYSELQIDVQKSNEIISNKLKVFYEDVERVLFSER